MKNHYIIFVGLLLGTLYNDVSCGPFDSYNTTEYSSMIMQFSGSQATLPGTQTQFSSSQLTNTVSNIMSALANISRMAPMGSPVQMQMNMAMIALTNHSLHIKGLDSLKKFVDQMNTMMAPIFANLSLPAHITNQLNPDVIMNKAYQHIDYSTYAPNPKNMMNFLDMFQQRYGNASWFINMTRSINGSVFLPIGMFLEIPDTLSAQKALFDKFGPFVQARPSVIEEIKQMASASQWTAARAKPYGPLLKFLTCFYLRKLDFNDMWTNWISTPPFNPENLVKILSCNMKFAMDALKANISNTVPDNLKTAFAEYSTKYLQTSGQNDPMSIASQLGGMASSLPTNTFETMLAPVYQNLSQIRSIFNQFRGDLSFNSTKPEMRKSVAKAASRYFKDNMNKILDNTDLQMLFNLMTDIEPNVLFGLLNANNNSFAIMPVVDQFNSSFWKAHCLLASNYQKFLMKQISGRNPGNVTLDRIIPLLICKADCDFPELFMNKSDSQTADLARKIIPILPRDVQETCRNGLGKFLRTNASSINVTEINKFLSNDSAFSLQSVYTASEIGKFPVTVLESVYAQLGKTEMDQSSAKKICDKLPKNLTIGDLGNLIRGKPLDFFKNRTASEISSNIQTIINNADSMDTSAVQTVVKTFLSSNTKNNIMTLLKSGNKKLAAQITLAQVKSANIALTDISGVSSDSLPDSIMRHLYQKSFANKTINDFNTTSTSNVQQVVNGLSANDFSKFNNSDRIEMIGTISTGSSNIKSSVRKGMFNVIVDELKSRGGDSASSYWSVLSESTVDKISPDVFLEAKSSDLAEFSKKPAFTNVVKKMASMSSDKASSFSKTQLRTFANYAQGTLNKTTTTLNDTHLDSLGPMIISNLPIASLITIEPSAFVNHISYFKGAQFQLSASEASTFGSYLQNVYTSQNLTLKDLEDLVVYLPSSFLSTLDKTELKKNGKALLKKVQANKKTSSDTNKNYRIGFSSTDDTDTTSRISSFSRAYVNALYSQTVSGRRRRQTMTLDCATIQDMGESATALSTSELSSMSSTEFADCLTDLGSTDKSWSTAQLTTLANKVKTDLYQNLTTIPDEVVGSLGKIALGFSSTDLSKLTITSLDTVSKLGAISTWDTTQSSVLAGKALALGANSDTLTAMTNLVCGISNISAISSTEIQNSISSLSKITATSCSNLPSLYTAVSQVYSTDLYSEAAISEMGFVFAGINATDFASNMSPTLLNSISTSALGIMPANTLNTLNTTLVSSLETTQLTSILSNPQASSLSSSLLTSLESARDNVEKTIALASSSTSLKYLTSIYLIAFAILAYFY